MNWVRLPRQMANIMENVEEPVVPLERKLYRHPTSRVAMGTTVRRSFIGTWMGKSTELGMQVRSSETGFISVGMRG